MDTEQNSPEEVKIEDTAPEEIMIEDTAPAEKTGSSFDPIGSLVEYAEILVFSVAAVLLLFTLVVRLCQVDGSSMRNTLYNGEMLITTSLGEPQQGDIIVFHMTDEENLNSPFNEALVKRVIATGGQTVRIDYKTATVSVDGQVLEEPYVALIDGNGTDIGYMQLLPAYDFDRTTGIFETVVPEGCLFVMGDNRNNSADSRSLAVGFVDERRVLGRVLLRLSPFTTDFSGED